MFRTSPCCTKSDEIITIDSDLNDAQRKILNDPNAWHNVFYVVITSCVDENVFSVIYDETQGRPNASIRILVSMMIIKEGFGWSDTELFDQCQVNLAVRRALGLNKLSDTIPAPSTYYAFKQAVRRYQVTSGKDLIGDLFQQLTKGQAQVFGVNGDRIRMDSTLMGSNITENSRLQLILECLKVFWKSLDDEQKERLPLDDRNLLNELAEKTSGQITYRLNDEEKEEQLKSMGELLLRLQCIYTEENSDKYFLIERLLAEQYTLKEGQAIPKTNQDIAADSLQSPHDVDATYRKKRKQTVQGYNINVTETCNDDGLNLVTDVQVEPAGHADNHYVQPAIKNTETVVGEVKEATMDGAYNDEDNREYAEKNNKTFNYTGLQGAEGRYDLEKTPEGLKVTDQQTGKTQIAVQTKSGKYRITTANGKYRYFTEKDIESCHRRKEIKNMPASVKNRRNNVEATIFQMSYFTRKNKTRYRGKIQTQVWAFCRAMWMNVVRIINYGGVSSLVPCI